MSSQRAELLRLHRLTYFTLEEETLEEVKLKASDTSDPDFVFHRNMSLFVQTNLKGN